MGKGLHKSILYFTLIVLLFTLSLPQLVLADEETREYIIQKVDQPIQQNGFQSLSIREASDTPTAKYEVVTTTKAELEQKQHNGEILNYQLNYPITAFLTESVPLINATSVWDITTNALNNTGHGQTICIIDSGVNESHPDLIGRQLDEYDFVNNLTSYTELYFHGTHVAGIALASGTLQGVAPDAKYVDAKMLDVEGYGDTADLIRAIDYCAANKEVYNISVITMSLGTETLFASNCDSYNSVITASITAARAKNITVIAASGNDGSNTGIGSPACIGGVVAIGATKNNDTIAEFSNQNSLVDIVAPGVDILSTNAPGGYLYASGTSMATPHIAGVIALLSQFAQGNNIDVTPDILFDAINDTGVSVYHPGSNRNYNRVDAYAAMQELTTFSATVTVITADQVLHPGDTLLNITAVLSSVSPQLNNITNVTLNSTAFNAVCENEENLSLTYSGTTWSGSCSLNITNLPATPAEYTFSLHYRDAQNNSDNFENITYLLHNITIPTYNKPCWELNSNSTNMSAIENYGQANLSLAFNLNQSCYTNQNQSLTDWDTYTKVVMINYTDINISSIATLQGLATLNETLNISLTTRFSYENTSVELSPLLSQLEQNTTIHFPYLGFNTKPQGLGSENYGFINTVWNNVSLTGISRYNVNISTLFFYDSVEPTVTLVEPIQNVTTTTTNITFIVNSTSTNLAKIQASFQNNIYQYTTETQNNSFVCTLNQSKTDLHSCTINNVSATDASNEILVLNITDFGNNMLSKNYSFIVDTSAPLITLNTSNGTVLATDEFEIEFNITDLTNATCWTNSNGVNTSELSCASSQNISFESFTDGNHTVVFYANDSFGFLGETHLEIEILEKPTYHDSTLRTQENGTFVLDVAVYDNDNVSKVSVYFNGLTYNLTNTTQSRFTLTIPGISVGAYPYIYTMNDTLNHTINSTQFNVTFVALDENQTILTNSTTQIVFTNQTNTTQLIIPKNRAPTNITFFKNETNTTQFIYLNLTHITDSQNVSLGEQLHLAVVTDGLNTSILFLNQTKLYFGTNQSTLFQTPFVENTTSFSLAQSTIREVISIGANETINATNPIKITLAGESGNKGAYAQTLGALTKITTVCDNVTLPTNIDLVTTRDCYGTAGEDLVIWTYHLTYFASYKDIPPPVTNSGGGGGGSSGGSSSAAPAQKSTSDDTVQLYTTYLPQHQETVFENYSDRFKLTKIILLPTKTYTNVGITLTKIPKTANDTYEEYNFTYRNIQKEFANMSISFFINNSWLSTKKAIYLSADNITYNLSAVANNTFAVTIPLVSTLSVKGIEKTIDLLLENQVLVETNVSNITQQELIKPMGEQERKNTFKKIVYFALAILLIAIGTIVIIREKRRPKPVLDIPKF